jgi:predicted dehydrogenase
VIGAGLIAQIMHLPHLKELDASFEVAALCDASPELVERCARRFEISRTFTDWRALLDEDLDAVVVCTSGSHAPVAIAAAEAGCHVFVEKPMCYSVDEADQMIAAADRAGVTLMVGYPKRYDPAFRRAREEILGLSDLRFVRVTTMEAPAEPYTAGYQLLTGRVDEHQLARWKADSSARVAQALGNVTKMQRRTYESVLLDTMVHEFNVLRGILGEPSQVTFASFRDSTTTVLLDFGGVDCVVGWLDLPGMAKYEMEFSFFAPDERVRLAFPSPYLRQTPTLFEVDRGASGMASSSSTKETVSFESPFKFELLEFHASITEGRRPLTDGHDGRRDIALCRSVIDTDRGGRPVQSPTDPIAPVAR